MKGPLCTKATKKTVSFTENQDKSMSFVACTQAAEDKDTGKSKS